MSDPSRKCEQAISEASLSTISSQELAAGPEPCSSLASQQTDLFGQPLAPASPSPQQAGKKASRTSATSGPCSPPSFESAALSLSLASRLGEMLDTAGSMEYEQTWKAWTTPAGLPIYRLAARARRISAKGYSGYPSPTANGYEPTDLSRLTQRREKIKAQGINGNGFGLTLQQAIPLWLAGYPSPRCTVRGTDANRGDRQGAGGPTLEDAVALLAGYATPASLDWRDGRASQETLERNSRPLNEQVLVAFGTDSLSCPAEMGEPDGRRLNPFFSLYLMGFPAAWGLSGVLALMQSRKRL